MSFGQYTPQPQDVCIIPQKWSLAALILAIDDYYSYSVELCPPVEVTVTESQTIIKSGSTTTELQTSTTKSGIVVKTTGTSPTLAARNYPQTSSVWEKPDWPWEQPAWKPSHCVASTITKTLVDYTTSTLSDVVILETTVLVEPGTCNPFPPLRQTVLTVNFQHRRYFVARDAKWMSQLPNWCTQKV